MPGYGTLPAGEGTGLLPWSWAEAQLERSRNFWLASRWPDGRPHVMPVWGVWFEGGLWVSSSSGSRKARNLRGDPRCTVTTEDPVRPLVIEARAEPVADRDRLEAMLAAENRKYGTDYGMDTLDPARNSAFRLVPVWAFGLESSDFTGSPTRWQF